MGSIAKRKTCPATGVTVKPALERAYSVCVPAAHVSDMAAVPAAARVAAALFTVVVARSTLIWSDEPPQPGVFPDAALSDSPIDGYKRELEGRHVDDDAVVTGKPPVFAAAVEID